MMRRHEEEPMAVQLSRTFELFERATRVVPGGIYGHQTPALLVPGSYPYFFARGEGSHVWDVDGNEYIDYMCSYGPIVLGHNHPAVEGRRRRNAGKATASTRQRASG